jgi:hypothetical protein
MVAAASLHVTSPQIHEAYANGTLTLSAPPLAGDTVTATLSFSAAININQTTVYFHLPNGIVFTSASITLIA